MTNTTILTPAPAVRTADQLRQHYEIEKELAARLRTAGRQERRALYHSVYDERLRRIPAHPLLTRSRDPAASRKAMAPQLRLVLRFLPPGGVYLEIGPGDCAVAVAVARHARRVLAVDVSDGLVTAESRPDNFELRLSDGIAVPAEPGSVDLAYSSQVMEHLHPEDAQEQLRNIHAALAPGGTYVCVTPNRLSGPWDVSRGFDEVATGLHLREYTVGELAESFRQAGFARVYAFVSVHGQVLSPPLPTSLIGALERGLERLPAGQRRRLAQPLTAVKIIGYR